MNNPVTIVNEDENTQVGTAKKSKYKVIIKRDLCIGAAACEALAANTFGMDGENIAFLKDGDWDEDELILAAAQSCPVFAIIIIEVETGKQIFPEPEINDD